METICNPQWRRKNRNYDFISPNSVFQSYQAYIEAVDVLCRSDLAQALDDRVTPALCEKFPKLLAVIKALSRGKLKDESPAFVKTREPTWEEILEEEPLEGDHWDEIYWGDSDVSYEEAPIEKLKSSEDGISVTSLSLPSSTLVIPQLPSKLSEKETINEIKYRLLGYSCRLGTVDTPFLEESMMFILKDIDQFNGIMAKLRTLSDHPFAGYAFQDQLLMLQTKITRSSASTILAAMAEFRKFLAPFTILVQAPEDYMQMLDYFYTTGWFHKISKPFRMQLQLWLTHGTLGPLLSIYQPSLEELFNDDLELNLPQFLDAKLVTDTGKYAYFRRQLECPPRPRSLSIRLDHSLEHMIVEINCNNLKRLMETLRPLLREYWALMSAVYLTRDTRIIEFIYKCIDHRLSFSDPSDLAAASALLHACWPEHNFRLSDALIPEFTIQHELVALILPIHELEQQWLKSVLTIAENMTAPTKASREQALEMELFNRKAIASIEASIDSLNSIAPITLQ